MSSTRIIAISIALFSGIAGGFMTGVHVGGGPDRTPPAPAAATTAPRPVVEVERVMETNHVSVTLTNTVTVTSVDDSDFDQMGAELVRMREMLAERDRELAAIRQQEADRQERWRERQQSFTERMQKMKEEEPERYAEMQEQRQALRERMDASFENRATFLESIDTSGMTPAERAVHEEIMNRIGMTWEILAKRSDSDIPTPPSHEDRNILRENYQVLSELYQSERDYVLRKTAASLGYDDSGAAEFSAYIQEVFELTSPPSMRRLRSGGPTQSQSGR